MISEVIRSRDNALVKRLGKIENSARERRSLGRTLIEGENLIRAYIESGAGEIDTLVAGESALERASVSALFESVAAGRRAVLEDALLARFSDVVASAGLIALVAIPPEPEWPLRIADAVVLERIQDPGNLGSILRSAQAAGVGQVFLTPGSALAWSPKVLRAGMGAHFKLAIREGADIGRIRACASGKILAASSRSGHPIYDVDLRGPVIWVFGNEGAGLSELAVSAAAETVCIPMPGGAESLNVASAAAVCLFEQARQRNGAAKTARGYIPSRSPESGA